MAKKKIGIKGYNGLPFVDEYARAKLQDAGITNKFQGKKWAVFGDSVSQSKKYDNLPKYYDVVSDKLGISVTSYAKGGSGYFKGNGSVGYGTGNIIDSISNEAVNGFDIVSFMAGVNEWSQPLGEITDNTNGEITTLCGAVKKSLELAIEKYPLAQLFLITPTPGTGNLSPINPNGLEKFVDKQIKIARMYNVPVLDLFHESNLKTWNDVNLQKYYSGNYVHLNADGHKYIAQIVKNFMELKLSF